jgi:hypothetical protein
VNPLMWGIVAAAIAATGWHAITEHHLHRRVWRRFYPGTVVPATTHDTWWHSLPKSRRTTVQACLIAAGLAGGIAYKTVPLLAITVVGTIVMAAVALLAIRSAGPRFRLKKAGLPQQIADGGDALLYGPLGEVSEAEDKLRRPDGAVVAVGAHAVQTDGAGQGGGSHGFLIGVVGEAGDGVEPCRQAAYPGAGSVGGERADEGVTARCVNGAHPAEVPVEAARGEQRSQG